MATSIRQRGVWWHGELYVHRGDVLLWLAHLAEMPYLTKRQRELLSAMIRDMHASTPERPEDLDE